MAPVHVALVGDAQVGKTSLVLAAAQKPARDDAPTPVLLPTRLDLEWEGYRATCVCHDTSSTSQEDAVATIRKCDVALICFAMDKPSTMRSALRTWLPLVNSAHDEIAVMFVGCKRDISVMEPGHPAEHEYLYYKYTTFSTPRARMQDLERSMSTTINVLRVEECSARDDSARAILQLACDLSLHPPMPIYNHVAKRMRCRAIRAFNRIFNLCTAARRETLRPEDLQRFHLFAYSEPLSHDSLDKMLQLLIEDSTSEQEAVTTEGLTRVGFIQLQGHMLMNDRADLIWRMLFKFGYDRTLHLQPALFANIPQHETQPEMISQLSPRAVAFLVSQFQRRVSKLPRPEPRPRGKGAASAPPPPPAGHLPLDLLLKDTDTHSFFHCAPPASTPEAHPLGISHVQELLVEGADGGHVSLESFLAIWAYCTLLDARKAAMAMVYLGFPDTYEDPSDMRPVGTTAGEKLLTCSMRRKPGSQTPMPRPVRVGVRVFTCLLFGSRGAGKTCMLEAFAGCKAPANGGSNGADGDTVCKAVRMIPAQDKSPPTMVVMVEVPQAAAEALVMDAKRDPTRLDHLLANDALLFGFDCTEAASYDVARTLLLELSDATGNEMPAALVSCKPGLGMSSAIKDRVDTDCFAFGIQHWPGLERDCDADAAVALAGSVVDIVTHTPENIAKTPALTLQRQQHEVRMRWVKYGVGAAVVVGAVAWVYLVASNARASSQETQGKGGSERGGASAKAGSAPASTGASGTQRSWWSK